MIGRRSPRSVELHRKNNAEPLGHCEAAPNGLTVASSDGRRAIAKQLYDQAQSIDNADERLGLVLKAMEFEARCGRDGDWTELDPLANNTLTAASARAQERVGGLNRGEAV
jgi:hypothetical protein